MTSALPLTALPRIGADRDERPDAAACRAGGATGSALRLTLHHRLDTVESEWRRFERAADCTAFQTFDWLKAWHRHVGSRGGVRPVIAVASYADGTTAFMLPLAVEPRRGARRLCWLGQELNDYNAPLLARDFSSRVAPALFLASFAELCAHIHSEPSLRHDWIELEKMPRTVGDQFNPFFHLAVSANPSGAHAAVLGSDWEPFYAARRSSATRRRDRAKRKHLSAFGEVGFVTSTDAEDARRTVQALMAQKRRVFARRGIPDIFARPGWSEFFLDVAAGLPPGPVAPPAGESPPAPAPPPERRSGVAVHVGRTQVGAACAAANLAIIFGDTYYHVLASYDDGELSRYGPGALHLRELLAYAIGRGLRRFDFTIGDEPYKLEWSDIHVTLGDYAAPATWRGVPAWCAALLRRPVKRFIKQTPWAWRAAARLRVLLGKALRRQPPSPACEGRRRNVGGIAHHDPPRTAADPNDKPAA